MTFRVLWECKTRSTYTSQPVLCAGWCRLEAANEEAVREVYQRSFPGDRIVSVVPLI